MPIATSRDVCFVTSCTGKRQRLHCEEGASFGGAISASVLGGVVLHAVDFARKDALDESREVRWIRHSMRLLAMPVRAAWR